MSSPAARKPRPLSPHLSIYRPQISSGMSIFHRITGVGLVFALPVFVWWLMALNQGGALYDCLVMSVNSIPGKVLLFGWTWALAYHLCTGIRHMLWDMGYFLDIKDVYKTGYAALAISTVLAAGLWYKLAWAFR